MYLCGVEISYGRYLSAEQFVNEIAADMGITDSMTLALMTRWVWNAQFIMNAGVAFTKKTFCSTLNFDELLPRAPKPCDFVWLLRTTLSNVTPEGDFCNNRVPFYEPIHAGLGAVLGKCTNGTNKRKGKCNPHFQISEQNYWFDISSNVCENDVLVIEYLAFNLDSATGQPLCDRTYMEPIKLYIQTCLALRGLNNGTVSIDEVMKHYQLTGRLARFARSQERKFALTEDEINQVMAKYNDRYYVSNNPYYMQRMQDNLNLERFAYGSPGYGYPAISDKT